MGQPSLRASARQAGWTSGKGSIFIICFLRRIAEGYDRECHIGKSTEAGRQFHPASAFTVTFWGPRDILSMNVGAMTFHELYGRYAEDVYRFAHWLSGNPEVARDITSETFVRALTAPEEPRMETVKAYLFAIARNLHRKQWRRDSRKEMLDETMADCAPSPDQALVQNEEYHRTIEAIKSLPEIDRTVLLMRAEEDLSYQDIAAATGLSVVAAKVKVFRARAKLASLLQTKIGEKV